jgi:hypothetical protein
MKKGLLALAALMLLALGSLAMSPGQAATDENCPPCKPPVCRPSDCCPSQCPN